jgi:hypothetical protein
MTNPFLVGPWTLFFAHPGHELRVHHFIERVRPTVIVLTDGSGATAQSRLDDSRDLLDRLGAHPSALFGPLTDREAYTALMAADASRFVGYAEVIGEMLRASRTRSVVIDAAEGYNPVHDICHWIGRSAVRRARLLGAPIDLFEVDLVSHPDPSGDGLRLCLDDEAFERKLATIARYQALKGETDAAFERYGREAFRVEYLRPLVGAPVPPDAASVPYYEQVGEARVKEGRYSMVLRYGTHVRRVIETLLDAPCPTT